MVVFCIQLSMLCPGARASTRTCTFSLRCSSPNLQARKDYLGPPVDVWSLGIVLFAMLAGYLPFHAKEKKQLSDKILAGVLRFTWWGVDVCGGEGGWLGVGDCRRNNFPAAPVYEGHS